MSRFNFERILVEKPWLKKFLGKTGSYYQGDIKRLDSGELENWARRGDVYWNYFLLNSDGECINEVGVRRNPYTGFKGILFFISGKCWPSERVIDGIRRTMQECPFQEIVYVLRVSKGHSFALFKLPKNQSMSTFLNSLYKQVAKSLEQQEQTI